MCGCTYVYIYQYVLSLFILTMFYLFKCNISVYLFKCANLYICISKHLNLFVTLYLLYYTLYSF